MLHLGVCWQVHGTTSLLQLVAEQGFYKFTVSMINTIAAEIGASLHGLGFMDKLASLIMHVLPDLQPEQLQQLLERRCSHHSHAALNTVLAEEAMEGVIDESDQKLLKDDMEAETKSKLVAEHLATELPRVVEAAILRAKSSSGSSGSSKSSVPAVPAFPKTAPKNITPSTAKALMPRRPGAYIVHQPSHNRWYITYPGAIPGSCQCTLTLHSEQAAIRKCIRWAWARHAEATGQTCPISGLD
eukprot:5807164-Lingulodinium_polyedra.AAC.1